MLTLWHWWFDPVEVRAEESSTPWLRIGFALFGAAALVGAVGYTFTRPAQQLITGRDPADDDAVEMEDFAAAADIDE